MSVRRRQGSATTYSPVLGTHSDRSGASSRCTRSESLLKRLSQGKRTWRTSCGRNTSIVGFSSLRGGPKGMRDLICLWWVATALSPSQADVLEAEDAHGRDPETLDVGFHQRVANRVVQRKSRQVLHHPLFDLRVGSHALACV